MRPQHLGDIIPEPDKEPEPARRGPGRRRATKKPNGRAGRNLPAAIAVGVSLVLLVLASLLIWPPAFPGLIALAAGAGVWEMTRALKVTGAEPPLIPLLGGALLMVGLAWHDGPDSLLIGLVVTVVAALLWRLADGVKAMRKAFTPTVMIAVYVPFLLSFAVLLQLPDADSDGRWRILCTLFAVVFSDTGGLHGAGLATPDGALVAAREDVGRHNAVDKLVGWALATGVDPAHHVLVLSGRLGYELVQKAIMFGVPIVAAVSAPSSLAIELAERFNVALVGFVRGQRANVYAHAWRIC